VQNRGLRSFAAKPTDAVDLIARWSGNGPVFEHRASVPIPLVTSTASVIPVVIRAPASFGNYRLSLRAEASAIGAVDLSGEVSVAKTGASQVVLPARVTLDRALAPSYAAGENVRVDVLWRPLNKINAYYSASVRIVDTGGNKIVAQDREPRVPTLLWTPGVVVADWFDLPLPRDVPPGEYRVEVLMYTDAGETSALLLDENLAPEETTVLGELEAK
jgi:hypothetical protein